MYVNLCSMLCLPTAHLKLLGSVQVPFHLSKSGHAPLYHLTLKDGFSILLLLIMPSSALISLPSLDSHVYPILNTENPTRFLHCFILKNEPPLELEGQVSSNLANAVPISAYALLDCPQTVRMPC
jgi:hypothetical protein